MARSLPENTVDAWTAIELARLGSPWIWLPTTNQGATWTGSHPGDVSTLLGRRLHLIENKAIEAQSKIDFGSDAVEQRRFLRLVEEAGLSSLPPDDVPPLGWVFYGLPLRHGAVFGSDWPGFPQWHHLLCPHSLDHAGVGSEISLDKLTEVVQSVAIHCAPPAEWMPGWPPTPLVLQWVRVASDQKLTGLPLAESADLLFDQMRELVNAAKAADEQSQSGSDNDIEFFNGDSAFELLQELGAVLTRTGHTALAVL